MEENKEEGKFILESPRCTGDLTDEDLAEIFAGREKDVQEWVKKICTKSKWERPICVGDLTDEELTEILAERVKAVQEGRMKTYTKEEFHALLQKEFGHE